MGRTKNLKGHKKKKQRPHNQINAPKPARNFNKHKGARPHIPITHKHARKENARTSNAEIGSQEQRPEELITASEGLLGGRRRGRPRLRPHRARRCGRRRRRGGGLLPALLQLRCGWRKKRSWVRQLLEGGRGKTRHGEKILNAKPARGCSPDRDRTTFDHFHIRLGGCERGVDDDDEGSKGVGRVMCYLSLVCWCRAWDLLRPWRSFRCCPLDLDWVLTATSLRFGASSASPSEQARRVAN